MALLLDLPAAARRELALRWGAEEATSILYRAMTDPRALAARLDALAPSARLAAEQLGRAPASFGDLLARLPVSAETLTGDLRDLAELGLVLALPRGGGAPRLVEPPFDGLRLYVPPDVAAALAAAR